MNMKYGDPFFVCHSYPTLKENVLLSKDGLPIENGESLLLSLSFLKERYSNHPDKRRKRIYEELLKKPISLLVPVSVRKIENFGLYISLDASARDVLGRIAVSLIGNEMIYVHFFHCGSLFTANNKPVVFKETDRTYVVRTDRKGFFRASSIQEKPFTIESGKFCWKKSYVNLLRSSWDEQPLDEETEVTFSDVRIKIAFKERDFRGGSFRKTRSWKERTKNRKAWMKGE